MKLFLLLFSSLFCLNVNAQVPFSYSEAQKDFASGRAPTEAELTGQWKLIAMVSAPGSLLDSVNTIGPDGKPHNGTYNPKGILGSDLKLISYYPGKVNDGGFPLNALSFEPEQLFDGSTAIEVTLSGLGTATTKQGPYPITLSALGVSFQQQGYSQAGGPNYNPKDFLPGGAYYVRGMSIAEFDYPMNFSQYFSAAYVPTGIKLGAFFDYTCVVTGNGERLLCHIIINSPENLGLNPKDVKAEGYHGYAKIK